MPSNLEDSTGAPDAPNLHAGEKSEQPTGNDDPAQFAPKSLLKEASTLCASGKWRQAIESVIVVLRQNRNRGFVGDAVADCLGGIPPSILGEWWSHEIGCAEKPAPFSSRDGRWLRRVPSTAHLSEAELAGILRTAFDKDPIMKSTAIALIATRGRSDFRFGVNFVRAQGYLQGGRLDQALRDARACVAYMPPHNRLLCSQSWAALSKVQYESASYTDALLSIGKAIQCAGHSEAFCSLRDLLLARVPDAEKRVFEDYGHEGLLEWLRDEEERRKPEFLRKRPENYYYYESMRERIETHCPYLPEPVLDKLLTMDSVDLDALLKSSVAIKAQASEFVWVLEHRGYKCLETYKTPDLTWEEVKLITNGESNVHLLEGVAEVEGKENGKESGERSREIVPYSSSRELALVEPGDEFVTRKQTLSQYIQQSDED